MGGRIVERTRSGAEHVWGTVTAWEPPRRVAFSWHPGREPDTAGAVEVTFVPAGDGGTDVRLVHGGWERYGVGAAEVRDRYESGWGVVLERFVVG